MKKLLIIAAALGAAWFQFAPQPSTSAALVALEQPSDAIAQAYQQRRSNVQVEGQGEVTRILPDDDNGSRHQRFILRLADGHTVLIAHNIDLAPRVGNLNTGDSIAFYGEYEWNVKGGVIHWTHRDPAGRHVTGWLKHQGKTYQ
jgi:hypothetical protein